MPMLCNAMLLLLYVHVCVTRTGWKTRPRPKTVILLIKQSIKTINQSISLSLSLSLSQTPSPPPLNVTMLSVFFRDRPILCKNELHSVSVGLIKPWHNCHESQNGTTCPNRNHCLLKWSAEPVSFCSFPQNDNCLEFCLQISSLREEGCCPNLPFTRCLWQDPLFFRLMTT